MLTKSLIASAVVLVLGSAPALAQNMLMPPAETPKRESPAAVGPPKGETSLIFLNEQSQDQWMVQDYMGRKIHAANGQPIGAVDDLVVGSDGRIEAVAISVGGFLGIGEKVVAVPFTALQPSKDEDGQLTLFIQADQDTLNAAPEYTTMEAKKRTARSRAAEQMQDMPHKPGSL